MTLLYIYEENKLAKEKLWIIVIRKDLIFIKCHFSKSFLAKAIKITNYFYNKLFIKNKSYNKIISKKV